MFLFCTIPTTATAEILAQTTSYMISTDIFGNFLFILAPGKILSIVWQYVYNLCQFCIKLADLNHKKLTQPEYWHVLEISSTNIWTISTFSISGTISFWMFLEKVFIQGFWQHFQDVCLWPSNYASALYHIKIQNYHIWSTFVWMQFTKNNIV